MDNNDFIPFDFNNNGEVDPIEVMLVADAMSKADSHDAQEPEHYYTPAPSSENAPGCGAALGYLIGSILLLAAALFSFVLFGIVVLKTDSVLLGVLAMLAWVGILGWIVTSGSRSRAKKERK